MRVLVPEFDVQVTPGVQDSSNSQEEEEEDGGDDRSGVAGDAWAKKNQSTITSDRGSLLEKLRISIAVLRSFRLGGAPLTPISGSALLPLFIPDQGGGIPVNQ